MAINPNSTFTPSENTEFTVPIGSPMTPLVFSFDHLNDGNLEGPVSMGFVTDSTGNVRYSDGASLWAGVSVSAPGSSGGEQFWPDTVSVVGTPTVAGDLTIYVRGDWTNFNGIPRRDNAQYIIHFTGAPLTATPAAVLSPATPLDVATVGSAWQSQQIQINNGSGNCTVTLTGAPAGIGVAADTGSFLGTPLTSTACGTSFYVYGTPTTAGGWDITLNVHDNISQSTYAGQYYRFVANNPSGGAIQIVDGDPVSSWPLNSWPNDWHCTQNYGYTFPRHATGGTAPYTWTVTGGSLPTGLTLNASTGTITGTPTGYTSAGSPATFTITATDSLSASNFKNYTLQITPGPKLTATGGGTATLPSTASVGVAITTTVLHSIGGDNSANFVGVNYSSSADGHATITPGVPPGMTFTGGSVTTNSGYMLTSTEAATFAGAPSAPATYRIFVSPFVVSSYGTTGLSDTNSPKTRFDLIVSGTNTLTISPPTLTAIPWSQYQAHAPITVSTTGTTPISWTTNVASYPSLLSTTLVGGYTAAAGTITGLADANGPYGNIPINVTSVDNTGATGSMPYTLTILPDIVCTNNPSCTMPDGTQGQSYPTQTLIFKGGDNTSYSYVFNYYEATRWDGSPGPALTLVASGTGNNTVTISSANLVNAGDFVFQIRVTTVATNWSGGVFEKWFNIPIHISSTGSVTITPIKSTICTSKGLAFNKPKVKVGAYVSSGNFSVSSVPSGWTYQGGTLPVGGFPTGSAPAFAQDPAASGTFNFTLQSVDSPTNTTTVAVTVDASGTTQDPVISPSSPTGISMYSNDRLQFTATMAGTCSGTTTSGIWTIVGPNANGVSISSGAVRGNPITLQVNTITVAETIQLFYQPDADPDRNTNVIINLLPGPKKTDYVFISPASPLPTGSVGVAYGTQQMTTAGGTGVSHFSKTWNEFPANIGLTDLGALNSSGALLTANGNFIFTISSHDSFAGNSLDCHWAAETFTFPITAVGQPSISSINVASGPVGGGTTVVVTGNNFGATDKIIITKGAISQIADGGGANGSTTYNSPTQFTLVTPVWTGTANDIVSFSVHKTGDATLYGTKANCFTYTGASFNITSFTPTSANAGVGSATVTITGSGFDNSAVVTFTPSWEPGSPITLSGITPPGPGGGGGPYPPFSNSTTLYAIIPGTHLTVGGRSGALTVTQAGNTKSVGTFNILGNSLIISPTSASVSGFLTSGTRGDAYSTVTLTASGGTGSGYVWSHTGSVPAGLTFSDGASTTATISGTPTNPTSQTGTFTASVHDSGSGVKSETYTINIIGGAITISSVASLPDGRVNSVYNQTLTASGGTGARTWSIISGSKPNGIDISSAGVLSGTPDSSNTGLPNTFSFTVKVVDSTSPTPLSDTKTFSLRLLPAVSSPSITSFTPAIGPIAGGTTVSIVGTNFVSGCRVQFGATDSPSVSFTDSSHLSAVSPATGAAGSVAITVINPDGGNGSKTGFAYQVSTNPAIVSVSNLDGPFAGGQSITLTGNFFTGVTSVKFGTSESDTHDAAFTVGSDTSITLSTPNGFFTGVTGDTSLQVNIYADNSSGRGTFPAGANGYTYRPPPIITAVVPNSGSTTGGQTVYVIGSNFFSRGSAKPRVFIGNVEVASSSITLVEQ